MRNADIPLLMTPEIADIYKILTGVSDLDSAPNCYVYCPNKNTMKTAAKKYGSLFLNIDQIAKLPRFVMLINNHSGNFLSELAKKRDLSDSTMLYALHNYYKPFLAKLLPTIGALDITILESFISGHANAKTIRSLIDATNPANLMPIKTHLN